jgi:hypothetical protein
MLIAGIGLAVVEMITRVTGRVRLGDGGQPAAQRRMECGCGSVGRRIGWPAVACNLLLYGKDSRESALRIILALRLVIRLCRMRCG